MKYSLYNSKNYLAKFEIDIKEPQIIYHYTNPTGLLGIILNKNLWTSDIQYLNDMEEFKYASSLIVNKIKEKTKSDDKVSFIENMTEIIDRRNILKEYQIYVCSFSEEGNLLSQWRAYAPDFNGYSIGFSFSKLSSLTTKQKYINYYLYPCIYDRKKQQKIIHKMVEMFLKNLYKILSTRDNKFEEILNNFIIQYLIVSSILKNSSFSEEKEWRLVGIRHLTKQIYKNEYRKNKSMIIPYSKFDFSLLKYSNPIREIYVGPSPHISLAVNSLKNILNQENMNAKIIRSRIPYRNW